MEWRNVVTTNISGIYLKSDMEDVVYIVLEEELVKLLVKVVPEVYGSYLYYDKNRKTELCIRLNKVLCGNLKSIVL